MIARSVFVRAPIPFMLHVEREDGTVEQRNIVISRVVARHAAAWEQAWSEFKPEMLDYTFEQTYDFVTRVVKAALPEPNPLIACPNECQCAGRQGLHELIDRMGREELDGLFTAVLEANAPKAHPRPPSENPAPSASTRRWRGSSWVEWAKSRLSPSPSKRSATYS